MKPSNEDNFDFIIKIEDISYPPEFDVTFKENFWDLLA